MSRYPEPGTTKSSEVGKFRRGSEISRFDGREGWDKELEGFGMEVVQLFARSVTNRAVRQPGEIPEDLASRTQLGIETWRFEMACRFEKADARLADTVVDEICPASDVWRRVMTGSRTQTPHGVRVYVYLELEEITLIDSRISEDMTEGNCLGTDSRRTLLQA
jgi:hypothetical protein